MSKVSVVIATYNGEKYIIKQLESVLNQTRRPDEVIIRDDCSTDNTPLIISNYIKRNKLKWTFIRGETNLGFEKNFVEALKMATGDVLFFSDQDDIWTLDKIKVMSGIMSRHSRILCLNSSYECIDLNGSVIKTKQIPLTANNGLIIGKVIKEGSISSFGVKDVFKYNISMGCTMAFRRELLSEFYSNAGEVPHDWLINLIAASRDGLFFYNSKMIKYRLHENNTIGQNDCVIQKREERIKLYTRICHYYECFSKCNILSRNKKLIKLCYALLHFYSKRLLIVKKEKRVYNFLSALFCRVGIMRLFLLRDLLISFGRE